MDKVKEFVTSKMGSPGRQIIIEENRLTDKQKQYLEWDRCYRGKLFAEEQRTFAWGTKADPLSGMPVSEDKWKPIYIPSIARDMVTTLASYIEGKDKFCKVTVTTTDQGLFKNLDVPAGYESDPAAGQEKAQAEALQKFTDAVLEQADFQNAVSQVLEQALPKEDAAMLIRYWEGKQFLWVPDRTWCSWEFCESDTREVECFTEMFFFTREGCYDESGSKAKFIFWREINQTHWIDYEIPLVQDKTGDRGTVLGTPVVVFTGEHKMGFCPVSVYQNTDKKSVFADEVLENIRGYIAYCNDIKAGIKKNMAPQWVLLKDDYTDENAARAGMAGPGQGKKKPLKAGKLWEMRGKSVQSFANNVSGYELALKDLDKHRGEIRSSANIIDIPADNEQSGKALALRLSPHYSQIDRLRSSIGKSIKDTVKKLLLGAMTRKNDIKLDDDVPIPVKLNSIHVSLDWGPLMPMTPDVVKEEIANTRELDDAGYMSKKSARGRLLPMVGVEDPDAETRQVELEKEQREMSEVSLANAAFQQLREGEEE